MKKQKTCSSCAFKKKCDHKSFTPCKTTGEIAEMICASSKDDLFSSRNQLASYVLLAGKRIDALVNAFNIEKEALQDLYSSTMNVRSISPTKVYGDGTADFDEKQCAEAIAKDRFFLNNIMRNVMAGLAKPVPAH